mmetsp:Transcript_11321/g.34679  ORF Transcript_11321/g.34679 Transcript_11321/m.34679 type:complete len:389 (+) Transcript_11321:162-1328(+)
MSADSPLTFSLPSKMHGENDAHGLCTVQLLSALQRRWERVLDRMQRGARYGMLAASTAAGAAQQRPATQAVLSFRTSAPLMAEYLLDYRRERDLLPVVLNSVYFASDNDGGGGGGAGARATPLCVPGALWGEVHLQYDFALVEQHLERSLLRNKQPVAVQVAQYVYRGDMKRSGALVMLRAVCPQREVSQLLREALEQQVDTQEHALALFTTLQALIEFLVSAHASRAALADERELATLGATLLRSFACETLHIPPPRWSRVSCPALDREARLAHLQALYLLLEQNLAGGSSPLSRVALRYRAELPATLRAELEAALPLMDRSHLSTVLRDLLVEQLCETRWPADARLGDFLEFVDPDLEEVEWFRQHLPGGLCLEHGFSVYQLIQER